jgi:hypothetical protein
MQMSEYEKLVWSVAASLLTDLAWDGVGAPPAMEPADARLASASRVPPAGTSSAGDVSALAVAVERLRQTVQPQTVLRTVQQPAEAEDGSVAASIGSTLLKATGVGPMVRGLLGLFGSGDREENPALFPMYSAPPPVAVEAGLDGSRQFTNINYSGSGLPRATAPVVQVNVQAMDSRSFMDHSDEIARAVKEAMLNSHGLNDVVMEI